MHLDKSNNEPFTLRALQSFQKLEAICNQQQAEKEDVENSIQEGTIIHWHRCFTEEESFEAGDLKDMYLSELATTDLTTGLKI